MAGYKEKKVKQEFNPESPNAINTQNPDKSNFMSPSWAFHTCDNTFWTFSNDEFFNEILPKLKLWETQTWNEILIHAKKQNHSIDSQNLNKVARNRLEELRIEAKSVTYLRLQGNHRLYGYRIGSVFCILWFDNNHGDNDTCVCRSRKK